MQHAEPNPSTESSSSGFMLECDDDEGRGAEVEDARRPPFRVAGPHRPQVRPRLLRPFHSATPLDPPLHEKKERSGG